MCVDNISNKLKLEISKKKFEGLIAEGKVGDEKVVLLKPQTYMNLSGISIKKAAVWYKIDPKNIIVIYDDLDLKAGKIRIRKQGTAGTHNGAKSVVKELGNTDFIRIRIGIGSSDYNTVDYVLSTIPKNEKTEIEDAVSRAAEAAIDIIENGIEHAMNIYN